MLSFLSTLSGTASSASSGSPSRVVSETTRGGYLLRTTPHDKPGCEVPSTRVERTDSHFMVRAVTTHLPSLTPFLLTPLSCLAIRRVRDDSGVDATFATKMSTTVKVLDTDASESYKRRLYKKNKLPGTRPNNFETVKLPMVPCK